MGQTLRNISTPSWNGTKFRKKKRLQPSGWESPTKSPMTSQTSTGRKSSVCPSLGEHGPTTDQPTNETDASQPTTKTRLGPTKSAANKKLWVCARLHSNIAPTVLTSFTADVSKRISLP